MEQLPQAKERQLTENEIRRQHDAVIKRLIDETNESLVVLNALLWKFNVKSLAEAETILSEYMAHMQAKLEADRIQKAGGTVIENFIKPNEPTNPTDQPAASDTPPSLQ